MYFLIYFNDISTRRYQGQAKHQSLKWIYLNFRLSDRIISYAFWYLNNLPNSFWFRGTKFSFNQKCLSYDFQYYPSCLSRILSNISTPPNSTRYDNASPPIVHTKVPWGGAGIGILLTIYMSVTEISTQRIEWTRTLSASRNMRLYMLESEASKILLEEHRASRGICGRRFGSRFGTRTILPTVFCYIESNVP